MSVAVKENCGRLIFSEFATCPNCGEQAEFDGIQYDCDYCAFLEESESEDDRLYGDFDC